MRGRQSTDWVRRVTASGWPVTIDWFVLVQVVPPVEPARASWRSAGARGSWQTEARCTQHVTEC